MNLSAAKIGFASVLLTALTGCTTYVVEPSAPPTVYTPPPAPEPVYVQPAPPPAPPPAVVVIQRDEDFYAPLSAYGEWVVVDGFGRCWRPLGVEGGWRPYASGHWELTNDGWYWESDEPWGWATYHYGRWELTPDYGWIWVPGAQWAPAWVTWREGGGYIGWAPLPPEPRPGITINVMIAPAAYCFVEERHMHDPVWPRTVIVNNTTIINRTVNITKTKIVNNVVINEGPRVDVIERASGRRIEKVDAKELRYKHEEPVAERHPNLRARPERQPEHREEIPPQNVRNNERENRGAPAVSREPQNPTREQIRPEPRPVGVQPPTPLPESQGDENRVNREQRLREQPQPKPVNRPAPNESERRREQARPEPGAATPQQPVHQPETQPEANRDNRERKQREQSATPAAREAHPEMPSNQQPPDFRGRQPRPEETRTQSPERPAARTERQKNEPGAENEKKATKANKRGRENTGTNSVDNGNQGERR